MNSVSDKWHDLSAQATLDALQAKPTGLSAAEAAARLETHGPNRLPEPARRSTFLRFLLHFHNVLIYVLLGAALITAVLGHLIDTLVILAVVVANAAIGFVQEGKAEKARDADEYVRDNPWQVIGAAAGIALLLGLLMSRR